MMYPVEVALQTGEYSQIMFCKTEENESGPVGTFLLTTTNTGDTFTTLVLKSER